jgi:polyisoprenoid-binding protein YceI
MRTSLVTSMKTIAMNNTFTWTACAVAIALTSCGAPAETNSEAPTAKEEIKTPEAVEFMGGTYAVDQEASTVKWKGTEITTKYHEGTVRVYKGSINVIDKSISDGFVAIDMSSMVCTDEGMNDDSKASLIGHLQSDDFFGVEQFPFSRIDIEGIKTKGDVSYAYGKMYVRDIGAPINFPVTISEEDGNMVVDASLTFDRSKHDVKFRSGAFPDLFPNLGDKLINDDIELDVHIVAAL